MSTPHLPELPDGWHYADDLVWEEPRPAHGVRSLVLGLVVAVAIAAALAGLVIWNADAHYRRGVAALNNHSYAFAFRELSAAKLLVVPYRNSQVLADQAQSEVASAAADEEQALARRDLVTGALQQAAAALERGDADAVVTALVPLPAKDVRAALSQSPEVAAAATVLAGKLTTAANEALRRSDWGHAERFAEALLVLRPSDAAATALSTKAQTGAKLSAKLAKARGEASQGHWRSALRLALAVTVVDKDFPGASRLVARARKALKPKPKPKPTPAATTPSTTAPATTTGGGSSGSSSQPAPP
jgi:hypothetical protein